MLLYTFNSVVTVNPALHDNLPYSPKYDLVPISHVVQDTIAVVASPALAVDNPAELQTVMRAKLGSLNYASFPGWPYLVFQAFQERAGADMAFVPYRSLTGALPDLMENRIQVAVLSLGMVGELARDGKLKILGLASTQRAPSAPDIPTATEQGFPELTLTGGHGIFARTAMPLEVREGVLRDLREVVNESTVAARIESLGFVLRATGPEEFASILDRNTEEVAALMRRLGPKARLRITQ